VSVTQDHYGHLADEAARAGFEAVADLIADATGEPPAPVEVMAAGK
jgi:hypothetical protein